MSSRRPATDALAAGDGAAGDVAVVIPVYKKGLSDAERFALRSYTDVLARYPRFVVCPELLARDREFADFWTAAGATIVPLEDRFFDGIAGYNTLMTSIDIYDRFRDFRFMLIAQLDAFVLSDRLADWVAKDYDYVGAPWFIDADPPFTAGAGNGGLSLRKTSSFIDVLTSRTIHYTDEKFLETPVAAGIKYLLLIKTLASLSKGPLKLNAPRLFRRAFKGYEDLFWSFYAKFFAARFSVCPPSEAVAFAFERYPDVCFEMNGHQLPFGVHAWEKYDPGFWNRHVEAVRSVHQPL